MRVVYIPDDDHKGGFGSNDDLTLAKGIIKEWRAKQKHEKDKHKQKTKSSTVSLGTMTGMIMLWSIPVTLGQIWLLDYVKEILKNGFHP